MKRKFIKKLCNDTSGATAVETAILAPVLMILFFGIVEFGMVLYSYNTFEHAARDIVRRLSANRMVVTAAENETKTQLPSWVRSNSTVVVSQTDPADTSKNIFTVTISAPMQHATPVNVLTNFLPDIYINRMISARAQLPQERKL